MPLVNLSETSKLKLEQQDQRVANVDRIDADWRVVGRAQDNRYFRWSEPVSFSRGQGYGIDRPSRTLDYERPKYDWFPTAEKSVEGTPEEEDADPLAFMSEAVKITTHGLCFVDIEIENVRHRFCRVYKDGYKYKIKSAVFGSYPLLTFTTKNLDAAEPQTGRQIGLIQLGTKCNGVLAKITEVARHVEEEEGVWVYKPMEVAYCDPEGNVDEFAPGDEPMTL